MESNTPKKINPLTSLMRQPKIYIKLPSQGMYWPEGSLDISPNGEYAVYSMTARDELLLKTPDALMNGQAVVDVVQNCIPAIKNAWEMPNIDLDVVLVSIRLATYGETMETSLTIGKEEMTYNVDLRMVLDILNQNIGWNECINVGSELALYIKPANYKTLTLTGIQNFETQKIISVVNDSTLSEEQKIETFKESFRKLTEVSLGIIYDSVYKIDSVAGSTEDPEQIREFLENCDKHIYDAIKQRLDELREQNSLKPIKVKSTPEMLEQGAPEEIEVPLVFDPANFFG